MLNTLKAVVDGEKIYWQEAVGNLLPANQPVDVLVTVLGKQSQISAEEQGRRRVVALQELRRLDAFSTISNPAEWERDLRKDRELPESKS